MAINLRVGSARVGAAVLFVAGTLGSACGSDDGTPSGGGGAAALAGSGGEAAAGSAGKSHAGNGGSSNTGGVQTSGAGGEAETMAGAGGDHLPMMGASGLGGATQGGEGTGGARGEGGSGECTPSGPEDCYNGVDDDCNGDVDCADVACTPSSECVPPATGALYGTRVEANANCPVGFAAAETQLKRGIHAASLCSGCVLTGTTDPACHGTITQYSSNGICSPETPLASVAISASSCTQVVLPDGTYYATTFATDSAGGCLTTGTPQAPAYDWNEKTKFCSAHAGAGCVGGQMCVPKVVTHCTLSEAATCEGGYVAYPGTSNGTEGPGAWHTDADDQRTCGERCGVVTVAGYCTEALAYTDPSCSGAGTSWSASCTNQSHSGFAQIAAVAPICAANPSTTGTLTPTGPRRLCCQ